MDVGVWLRSLGLGQYEAAFRDNEIDGEVLPKLTVEDLKDLGVAVVGHRRKIMSAIEALNAPSAAPAAAARCSSRPTPLPDAAERRQLTVMFCDLVGSTALSARLDPEDMRQVIRAYQDACSGVVARYDGFVAKFLGDGILAYFGFPRAHEDDAARAVHAGLEIAEVVAGLADPRARKARRARRHRDRPRRRRRSRRARARRRSRRSSATRPISPRGCRASPTPAASWSPRRRGGCSATGSA